MIPWKLIGCFYSWIFYAFYQCATVVAFMHVSSHSKEKSIYYKLYSDFDQHLFGIFLITTTKKHFLPPIAGCSEWKIVEMTWKKNFSVIFVVPFLLKILCVCEIYAKLLFSPQKKKKKKYVCGRCNKQQEKLMIYELLIFFSFFLRQLNANNFFFNISESILSIKPAAITFNTI